MSQNAHDNVLEKTLAILRFCDFVSLDLHWPNTSESMHNGKVNVQPVDAGQEIPIGQVLINNKPLSQYFTSSVKCTDVLRPFALTGLLGKYNVFALARGGGQSGQADAVKLAIAKALFVFEGDAVRRILRKGLSFSFLPESLTK